MLQAKWCSKTIIVDKAAVDRAALVWWCVGSRPPCHTYGLPPVRLDHEGFFKRYRMLLPSVREEKLAWSMEDKDPQKLCVKFLDVLLEEGTKPISYTDADGSITRANQIPMTQRQPEPMVFPKADVMRKGPHDKYKLKAHRVFHQNAQCSCKNMREQIDQRLAWIADWLQWLD